jgi:hypothetical protein
MASRIFDMAQLSFGRASVRVVVDDSMELLGMLLMEFPGMYTSRGMVKEAALDWMRQSMNPETQGLGSWCWVASGDGHPANARLRGPSGP